jgi:hypothetical protein
MKLLKRMSLGIAIWLGMLHGVSSAALSANTVWEVRPTNGSDTNGGGFVAGASGTDWSQQNSPQYSVTDGVTAGTTTITSATANFGTDVVGNLIYVQGGTGGVVAGWYQISSCTNATTIVVDRLAGLTAGTGVTLHIGGALKTLSQLSSVMIGSNKAFCKAEATQTTAATLSFTPGAVAPSRTVPYTRLIGYTTSRTDAGMFTVQLITNTGLTAIVLHSGGATVENFTIDCNSLGTSMGIDFEAGHQYAKNCKVSNFTLRGICANGNNNHAVSSEVTGGTSAATAAIDMNASVGSKVRSCYVHDNACVGVHILQPGVSVQGNLIANNTGASSDGVLQASGGSILIEKNTIYGSGEHGINVSAATGNEELICRGNILAKNGGYGISFTSGAGVPADPNWDGNAYWNNTSGTRNNMDDTSTVAINGVAPYANALDVAISGSDPTNDPFTAKGSGNFTLNNTAGAGKLLRGTAPQATIPGATGTGHEDFGCFQHQDAGGGGRRPEVRTGSILPPRRPWNSPRRSGRLAVKSTNGA